MPRACKSARHSPCDVMPAAGSAATACCHDNDFPFAETLPSENITSSGFGLPSREATRSAINMRALIAASFTDGDNDGAVVEPPDGFAAPSFELPIRSFTSLIPSPSSSATIALVYVRVPVPRSCVPTATSTDPSREIVTSTLHWLFPPPPHVPTAHPIPRFNGPGLPPATGFLLDQPISFAPRSNCR